MFSHGCRSGNGAGIIKMAYGVSSPVASVSERKLFLEALTVAKAANVIE